MKITSLDPKLVSTAPVQERKASISGAGSSLQPSATVEISEAARAAVDAMDGNGQFDAAKVQKMAQAIRDGSFQVNADAIADRLIANARELLQKTYR